MKNIVINGLLLLFTAAAITAGPKIRFEKKEVDAGKAEEEKNFVVEASFIFKNTGNSDLKIEKVIPACGCTKIISYDSLIPPGKTGKMNAEMRLEGFRSGPTAKAVTVLSNAENEPVAKLVIKATVRELITVSEPYISLNANYPSPKTVLLSSGKKDLEIKEVIFIAEKDSNTPLPNWKTDIPVVISFKWTALDSTSNDGYRFYKLDLFMPSIEHSVRGVLYIKTNHPQKPQLVMWGSLLK